MLGHDGAEGSLVHGMNDDIVSILYLWSNENLPMRPDIRELQALIAPPNAKSLR